MIGSDSWKCWATLEKMPPLVEQLEAIVERDPGRRYPKRISSERMTSRMAASRYG